MILAFSICIASAACGNKSVSNDDISDTDTTSLENDTSSAEDDTTNTKNPEDNAVKITTRIENYLSDALYATMENALYLTPDHFSPYNMSLTPFAINDMMTISDCNLRNISIPVYKTLTADANKNFVFTLHVFKASLDGLKAVPKRSYEIKINAEQYELEDNSLIMRFVTVDLSSYNITLSADETLGFSSSSDTIVPSYIPVSYKSEFNEAANALLDVFPQIQGNFSRLGTSELGLGKHFLLFDFEWEKTYTTYELESAKMELDELNEAIATLRQKYAGKYVSILGDSISTFNRISNDAKINASLNGYGAHYNYNNSPPSWEYTYWGRLISDTGIKLCVNNSYSGSSVYGRSDKSYLDSAALRATELHDTSGNEPDVIIFYMGTNDLRANVKLDLYNSLKNADKNDYNAIIEAWFDSVLISTSNGTNCVAGTTYTTFEQAYAISLYKMTQRYEKAEIICIDLIQSLESGFTQAKTEKYNFCIETLAEYFGATVIHQSLGEVTFKNKLSYSNAFDGLHPNARGHAALEKLIVHYLYKKTI